MCVGSWGFVFPIATVEFQHYLHNPEGSICSWEFALGLMLVAAFLEEGCLEESFHLNKKKICLFVMWFGF